MGWINLNFSTENLTGMLISVVVLFGVCIWAQTFRKKTYNIIGNRGWFFLLSLVLIIASIWSLMTHGLNYGLDFTGGTLIEVGFYEKVNTDQIRNALEEINPEYSNATIQVERKTIAAAAGQTEITKALIRIKELKALEVSKPGKNLTPLPTGTPAEIESKKTEIKKEDTKISPEKISTQAKTEVKIPESAEAYKQKLGSENVNRLTEHLKNRLGNIEIYKIESIGPIIGKELKKKALFALLIALGTQLIYITFRFGSQLRYGLAADIAMAHDIIIMVGIYSIFSIFNKRVEADSTFLAALLTVIGYSIMDSIIIFDRIRENLKIMPKGNFQGVVNLSVNQTMTRSINTLMTCLLTLFAIYFFGGSTLKNFSFALLVGLTSGAYSSIFIASPLLVILDNFIKKQEAKKTEARRKELIAIAEAKRKEKEAEKLKRETEGKKFKKKKK